MKKFNITQTNIVALELQFTHTLASSVTHQLASVH